jgi:hypothetical protein
MRPTAPYISTENVSYKYGCLPKYRAVYYGKRLLIFSEVQTTSIDRVLTAVSTSETTVKFHHTTWHNTPEDSHLHSRGRQGLTSSLPKQPGAGYVSRSIECILPCMLVAGQHQITLRWFVTCPASCVCTAYLHARPFRQTNSPTAPYEYLYANGV